MYRPEVGETARISCNASNSGYEDFDGCDVYIISYSDDRDGDEIVTFCHYPQKGLGALVFDGDMFRPLKSKRDEEIEDLTGLISDICTTIWCKKGMAKVIYDNGYRKQMPYDDFINVLIEEYDRLAYTSSSKQMAERLAAKLNRTPEEDQS